LKSGIFNDPDDLLTSGSTHHASPSYYPLPEILFFPVPTIQYQSVIFNKIADSGDL